MNLGRNCNTPSTVGAAVPATSVFDALFDNFFTPSMRGSSSSAHVPSINVAESKENYTITADLPGLAQENVNVELNDNVLTIQGERRDEVRRDDDRWHVIERSSGTFARSIRFPVPVDSEGVKASLRNGVLAVTVPKTSAAKGRKVAITGE